MPRVSRAAHKLGNLLPAVHGMRRASAESVSIGLLGQGTLVISGVLLARLLGPQDRGYVALLMLWPIVIAKVGELGVPTAAAYYIAREPKSFSNIVRLVGRIAKRQVPLLLLCHLLILVAFLKGKPGIVVNAAVLTLVGVPAAMAVDYGLTLLQGQRRFGTLNALRMVNATVVCAGLLILLVTHKTSLVSAVAVLMLALSASGAAFLVAALSFGRPRTPGDGSTSIRDLVRFGLQGLLGSTYPVDTFRIDQMVVGLFLSSTALGLYVVGIAFTNLPMLISQSLAYVAYPGVAAQADHRQRRRTQWQFFLLFGVVSVAIVAVLEASVAILIPWFFGTQFAPSIGIARIALVGALVLSARRILAETLRGAGYPAAGTFAEIALLAVLIPAMVVGGHYWGAEGIAGAVLIAGVASLAVLIAFEARTMTKSEDQVVPVDAS